LESLKLLVAQKVVTVLMLLSHNLFDVRFSDGLTKSGGYILRIGSCDANRDEGTLHKVDYRWGDEDLDYGVSGYSW